MPLLFAYVVFHCTNAAFWNALHAVCRSQHLHRLVQLFSNVIYTNPYTGQNLTYDDFTGQDMQDRPMNVR
jgi:hypothetical protein